MRDEEILAIRKIRHEISQECGHDVHKVAEYYRAVGGRLRRAAQLDVEKPTGRAVPAVDAGKN